MKLLQLMSRVALACFTDLEKFEENRKRKKKEKMEKSAKNRNLRQSDLNPLENH